MKKKTILIPITIILLICIAFGLNGYLNKDENHFEAQFESWNISYPKTNPTYQYRDDKRWFGEYLDYLVFEKTEDQLSNIPNSLKYTSLQNFENTIYSLTEDSETLRSYVESDESVYWLINGDSDRKLYIVETAKFYIYIFVSL